MKNNYLYTLLLSLLCCFTSFYGQEKRLEKADKEFNNFSYVDARNIYLQVVDNGYQSKDICQKLGDSYYFNAELEKASKWYAKLYYDYRKGLDSEYLFRYSQSLKSMKQYELADTVMREFYKETGRTEKRANLFIDKQDYLNLIELQSGKFEIKNLPINSELSDFGPSFMRDDAIVFASSRAIGGSRAIHKWTQEPFLDLYSSKRESKNSTNLLAEVDELGGTVNTKLHESSTVFTRDGNTMYFTRNNFTKKRVKSNSEGTTLLKLYKASRGENGKWSDVVELPFNSDNYSVAHPALSVDETKLYFASDMPGTTGLSDLFYVTIKGGDNYGKPVNLGKSINTEGRETFPFISKDGKLYFSSDGHIGLGGLDVFVATPSNKKFKDFPYNLGEPINSPTDDFSFIIDKDTKLGYFTSNRPGGHGNDDIYSFSQKEPLIVNCNQYLEGIVTDADSRKIIPGAKVTLFDENMKELSSTIADINAKYSLPITCGKEYVIRAFKQEYKRTEVDFASTGVFELKHSQPLQLRKGDPEIGVFKANLGDDLAKLLQLNPIYFDFDKSFIRPDAEIELQKVIAVMREYPNMEIDVRSHTDSRAPYNYNINLSTRRNKSTIQYLINKGGILSTRLTGRGYGETQLTNGCADGIDCTEEEHQLNRRSEFIIVKQ